MERVAATRDPDLSFLEAVTPSLYPELDRLPLDELAAWESRTWDWTKPDGGW